MQESEYQIIEGIKCYAPSLALENDGFKTESFDYLWALEDGNFWFEGRADILKYLIRNEMTPNKEYKLLEIGCGTGFMLRRLSEIEHLKVTGSEIYLSGLHFARQRLAHADFIQLDATQIPFKEEYDMIGAFDVLEHIESDTKVMQQVSGALKPNGHFFITVPQYDWMWSYLDDYACHKRRYSRQELKRKLEENGFEIKYLGSFVTFLFPFMMVSRLLKKKNSSSNNPEGEFKIPKLLNWIFSVFMKMDYALIRLGFKLPFGGSLICVAQKRSA